jgi:hypothetical protein
MDSDSDVVVDVDLSGVTIGAGDSLVINSNHGGECSGAFPAIFGFPADLNADCLFGDGDDRYILTDTADGSNLLDIYGEFGVDGTGSAWEYTDGYSYRLPGYNGGSGGTFAAGEWYFGGVDSLETANPEEDLLNFTTPGGHAFEANCYTSFDLDDFALFATCLAGPDVSTPPKGCSSKEFYRCDIQGDNDVDFEDFCLFMEAFAGQ